MHPTNWIKKFAPKPEKDKLEDHHLLRPLRISSTQAMLLFSGTIGLAAGCAASVFYGLLNFIVRHILEVQSTSLSLTNIALIVLTPSLGGLICGVLLHYFAPDARGGVSEVIDAVLHKDGFIRTRVGVIKTVASAICIGTGGSAGREGPVVQIGASVGSTLAQVFQVSQRKAKLLVACGAAGGVAAVFNAPIAGAFFVAEIITGRFEMGDMTLLFTSSAMGATIARLFLGDRATFDVPAYHLASTGELLLHCVLGALCAVGGHLFIGCMHKSEKIFSKFRLHPVWAPAVGGLGVGLVGLFVPQVFGTGGDLLETMMIAPDVAGLLLLWFFSKMIATSFTLGSGGSGGDLMPSLFLGSALGGAFGHAAHFLFPASTMPAGAYALVGATSLFAGVAHAPVTGIILGFEMGRDYGVILPLMVSCSISALLSRRFRSGSLYTLKLQQKGIDVEKLRGLRSDPLDLVKVSEVMTHEFGSVPPHLPLQQLLELFTATGKHGFVVIENSRLTGIVTLSDVQAALERGESGKTVSDIATPDPVVCYENEPLSQAVNRLGTREVGRMPVVSTSDSGKVIAVLRRSDILRGYSLGLQRLR